MAGFDPNLDPQLAGQADAFDVMSNEAFEQYLAGTQQTGEMPSGDEYMVSDLSNMNFGAAMTADNAFAAPQMPAPEADEPADNFDPGYNLWYNEAPPYAPGAAYKKRIGWHFAVQHGPSMAAPPSGYAPSSTSGYSTPVMGPGAHHTYPYGMPMGAQAPIPVTMPAPTLQVPQKLPRPASRAAPLSTPVKRKGKPSGQRETSIYQACICAGEAKKQRVKRPRNCFILYRSAHAPLVAKQEGIAGNQQKLSSLISERWNKETPEVKAHFQKLADEEKARHAAVNPGYSYKPGTALNMKFGDEKCTCGAYEANMEYNSREAKLARTHARIQQQADAEEDAEGEEEEEDVLPDFNPFKSEGGKRKRSSHESPRGTKRTARSPHLTQPRPARSTRNSTKSYREVGEDDDFTMAAQPQLTTTAPPSHPAPKPAPMPIFAPGLALPGQPQQQRRITPPQAIMTTTEDSSPAQNTRSRTASAINDDELFGEFIKSTPSPAGSRKSSSKKSSQSTRRSTRIAEQEQ